MRPHPTHSGPQAALGIHKNMSDQKDRDSRQQREDRKVTVCTHTSTSNLDSDIKQVNEMPIMISAIQQSGR